MADLKTLQSKVEKLRQDLKENNREKSNLDRRIKEIKKESADIGKQIHQLKNKDVVVSEHAYLRYLERVKGVDMEEVRQAILPDSVKNTVGQLGDGTYPLNGFKIKVKGRTIVTVLTTDNED